MKKTTWILYNIRQANSFNEYMLPIILTAQAPGSWVRPDKHPPTWVSRWATILQKKAKLTVWCNDVQRDIGVFSKVRRLVPGSVKVTVSPNWSWMSSPRVHSLPAHEGKPGKLVCKVSCSYVAKGTILWLLGCRDEWLVVGQVIAPRSVLMCDWPLH